MIALYLFLSLMIIAALLAIELKDLFSSVIALAASGLCLSVIFLILKAPELAIAQLVVEVLLLVILVRTTIKKDLPFSASGRWFFNTCVTTAFITVFIIVAFFTLKEIPPFGFPLMKIAQVYLEKGRELTGATNLVSSVALDFRAYDTFGEATVLFTAVVGVLAVMRRKAKKDINEPDTGE